MMTSDGDVVHGSGTIRVFVSYAHEVVDGYRAKALDLTQSLRIRGIEAVIDQFVEHEPPFWPRWMLDQVRAADFVLCLTSPAYRERAEGRGEPSSGRGARWEGAIITEEIYSSLSGANRKFVPVVLDDFSPSDIPDILFPVGRSYYRWPDDDEMLYRRLTGQPVAVPAALGEVIVLGAKGSRAGR
jgi:hypothetical protein